MARGKKAAADAGPVDEPWQLPEGWRWERLGDLVTKSSAKHQPDRNSALPFVGLEHIPSHEMRLSGVGTFAQMRSSGSAFEPGDVLYSRLRPYLNKVWVADRRGACSGEFFVLRPHSGVNARYLALQLHGQRYLSYASNVVTGDRPRIDFDLVGAFLVPVPDAVTQDVIVKRIDAMFAEIDEGEAALAEARAGVETYRKSLLKAAVTGDLTADWRRQNPPRETGTELLQRILAERRARWEAEPKNARRKYVEPVGPDTDGLPVLPEGWAWASLDQLSTDEVRNGLSIKEAVAPTDVRALRLGALAGEKVDWSVFRYLPIDRQAAVPYGLRGGDFLVSRANGSPHLVGKGSICVDPPDDMIFPDTAIRYRLLGGALIGRWITTVWTSPLIRGQIAKLAKTTAGILKISQEDIAKVAVPLTGCNELAKANELASAGHPEPIEKDIAVLLRTPNRLRQSILAAAFRGEITA